MVHPDPLTAQEMAAEGEALAAVAALRSNTGRPVRQVRAKRVREAIVTERTAVPAPALRKQSLFEEDDKVDAVFNREQIMMDKDDMEEEE